MKNHELIASMLDTFYEKVASEKLAPLTKKANETLASASEGKKVKKKPGMGAAGTEKNSDIEKNIAGVSAPNSDIPTEEDAVVNESADGPNALTADEGIDEQDNQININEQQKEARARRLGNAILAHIADFKKQASEVNMLNGRANMAYKSFTEGWVRGFEKKAEDMAALMDAGFARNPFEAELLLNKIPEEDPAAVLPEEVVNAPEAALAEGTEQLDALAAEMAAQGVSPEDVIEAAKVVDELQNAGVSPEEIVQAAVEAGAEVGAEEKQAFYRRSLIKNYIKNMLC